MLTGQKIAKNALNLSLDKQGFFILRKLLVSFSNVRRVGKIYNFNS